MEGSCMLAKYRVQSLFAFSFCLCAGASWAQLGAIEGDVKGPDGKPVQNAQILIEREDMKGTYKGAKTDKKGHYIYNGLPVGGQFTVTLFVDGQKRDSVAHVRSRLGDPAQAHFDLQQNGDEQQAALNKGLEAFQKAIALKPEEAPYHNNYALALAKAKKFDEAQSELNKAAQLDPTSAAKYFYNLGAVLVNTGQTEPATAAFKKAIEVDPNYADAEFQYATALSAKLATGSDGKVTAPTVMKEALEKYIVLQPTAQFS